MATKKYVDILQRGTVTWNAWRVKRPNETIDLSGAILSGAILSEAILSGVILSGAILTQAYLSRTYLSRADLSNANLSNANLSEADLSDANLSRANLGRANLSRANLSGANLSRANLSGANLSQANLSGTYFSGTNLTQVNLTQANLTQANLTQVNLSGTNLTQVNLTQVNLSGTNLTQANLTQANLTQANLSGTNLTQASFKNTEVGWTIFGNLDLRTIKDLETIQHKGPSYVSTSTLSRSHGNIPKIFLRGAGLNDPFIEYVHSLITKPNKYHMYFISYSRKDESFARKLHDDLQQEGIRCWLAPEVMDIEDRIKHSIGASVHLYDKLLLILSEHSIESNWVAYAVEKALSKELQGTPNVLYPVRVDPTILTCTESWAQKIKKTRYISNFAHWSNPEQYRDNFKLLLHALNA